MFVLVKRLQQKVERLFIPSDSPLWSCGDAKQAGVFPSRFQAGAPPVSSSLGLMNVISRVSADSDGFDICTSGFYPVFIFYLTFNTRFFFERIVRGWHFQN